MTFAVKCDVSAIDFLIGGDLLEGFRFELRFG